MCSACHLKKYKWIHGLLTRQGGLTRQYKATNCTCMLVIPPVFRLQCISIRSIEPCQFVTNMWCILQPLHCTLPPWDTTYQGNEAVIMCYETIMICLIITHYVCAGIDVYEGYVFHGQASVTTFSWLSNQVSVKFRSKLISHFPPAKIHVGGLRWPISAILDFHSRFSFPTLDCIFNSRFQFSILDCIFDFNSRFSTVFSILDSRLSRCGQKLGVVFL